MKAKVLAVIISAMFPLGALAQSAGVGVGVGAGVGAGASGSGSQGSGSLGAGLGVGAGVQGSGSADSGSAGFQSNTDVKGSARARGTAKKQPEEMKAGGSAQVGIGASAAASGKTSND